MQSDTLQIDKQLPQAIDLEEAVLGAILIDKNAMADVVHIIKEEAVFHKPSHQVIFSQMLLMYQDSKPIDILTMTHALRKAGHIDDIGGPAAINEMPNRVSSTANLEYHCRILIEMHLRREGIRELNEAVSKFYDLSEDVFSAYDTVRHGLDNLIDNNTRGEVKTMTQSMSEFFEDLDTEEKTGMTGVPSGFNSIDDITFGFQNTDLVIIAARPGMGKTAFVSTIMRNAAIDFNSPIGFFSMEMSTKQVTQRLVSGETDLPLEKILRKDYQEHDYKTLVNRTAKLSKAPIYIEDTAGLTIIEMKSKARRMKNQYGIKLLIVDYLQLAHAQAGNREQEISKISGGLKGIAKELNIPVIALSQLSRAVEQRGGDKRPQLSDLRDSGSIEQDADLVLFLYRPEYYGFMTDEGGFSTEGIGEVNFAKHRNGKSGHTIGMSFIGKYTRWEDLNRMTPLSEFENQESAF